MPISSAYDFLSRAFVAHERRALAEVTQPAGTTISRTEGKKLGAHADTFADFYANEREPGKAATRSAFTTFAGARFDAQMKSLTESLAQGPGVDGFKLAADVADNWKAFVAKPELFKYAELAPEDRLAILENHSWKLSEIHGAPAATAVSRLKVSESKLPPSVRAHVDAIEAKHFVSADPATTPPLAADIFQVKLKTANEVKVEGVVVGYTLSFASGGTQSLDVDGKLIGADGLGLHEIQPGAAVGFAALTPMQKIERIRDGELDAQPSQATDGKTVAQVLQALGSPVTAAQIASVQADGLDFVAGQLDHDLYYQANVSLHGMGIHITRELLQQFSGYDALVAHIVDKTKTAHGQSTADEVADALGNGWADIGQPSIEVFEEGGQVVGAKLRWSVSVDGDHDYWHEAIYDHTTKKFIGGASGGYEMDSDVWES